MRTLLNLASRINKSNNQINVNFQKKKLPERFFKDFEQAKKEFLNVRPKFEIELKG